MSISPEGVPVPLSVRCNTDRFFLSSDGYGEADVGLSSRRREEPTPANIKSSRPAAGHVSAIPEATPAPSYPNNKQYQESGRCDCHSVKRLSLFHVGL